MATGGTTSSSKRKSSSSSHKKKSSKHSSQVRRKKSRSRKKDKSKKVRRWRRDVSVSYSDDGSRAEDSVSFSSSDSEDDYRHRKTRSRTRGETKGGKKRVRRNSLSREDGMDSPHRKKRKGVKLNDGDDVRKKSHKSKRGNGRSRRSVSVDSISSDSFSCSTCSGESEVEGRRGRPKRRGKDKTSLCESYKGKGRYGHRSRSCSSCSLCSEHSSHHNDENLMRENHSKRLKSVINEQREAERSELTRDENKAEIIQAYDDFPRCRSDDSYDGGRKKQSPDQTHVVYEKNRRIDDGRTEQAFTESSKGNAGEDFGQGDRSTDVIGSAKVDVKREVNTSIISIPGDDLESILRQKALENLRKFRGGINPDPKAPSDQKGRRDSDVKQQPSTAKVEHLRAEPNKEIGSGVSGGKRIVVPDRENIAKQTIVKHSQNLGLIGDGNKKPLNSTTKLHEEKSSSYRLLPNKDKEEHDTKTSAVDKKFSHCSSIVREESSRSRSNRTHIPTSCNSEVKLQETKTILNRHVAQKIEADGKLTNLQKIPSTHGAENTEAAPGTISTHETRSNVWLKSPKHVQTSSNSSDAKLHETKNIPNKRDSENRKAGEDLKETKNIPNKLVAENPEAALRRISTNDADKGTVSSCLKVSSCVTSATGEHGSSEPKVPAKEGSEFEQKTMSVMRGGEMVQVSYKVYIPKKPPALARRQLNR